MAEKEMRVRYAADVSALKKAYREADRDSAGFAGKLKGHAGIIKGSLDKLGASAGLNLGAMGSQASLVASAFKGLGGAGAASFGLIAGAAAAAGGVIIGVLLKAVRATVAYAEEVRKVKEVSGANARTASHLVQIMNQVGTSTQEGARAFLIFGRNLHNETERFARWFTAAEISRLKTQDLVEALPILRERYAQLSTASERSAFLMDAFGRGGNSLRRVMELTGAELREVIKDSERLGVVLTEEDLEATRQFEFAMDDLKDSILGIELALGRKAIPALIDLTNALTETIAFAGNFSDKVEGGKRVVGDFFASITDKSPALAAAVQDVARRSAEAHERFGILARAEGPVVRFITKYVAASSEAAQASAEVNEKLHEEELAFDRLDSAIETASKTLIQEWARASSELDRSLDALVPKFGEGFTKASTASKAALLKGLTENKAQLDAFVVGMSALGPRLERIAGRDISQAFLARLQEMGAGAVALIADLNKGSDAELAKLAAVFGGGIATAKAVADQQFDKYPANWSAKLQMANRAVFRELDDLAGKFNALPEKTGPMADELGRQIQGTTAEILALQRSGAVALTPYQNSLLETIGKERSATEAARLLGQLIDELHGRRAVVTLDLRIDAAEVAFLRAVSGISGRVVRPHAGGLIPRFHPGGLAGNESLAILEAGEFVMRRRAVDVLGAGTLSQLNRAGAPGAPAVDAGGLAAAVGAAVARAMASVSIVLDGREVGRVVNRRLGAEADLLRRAG